MLDRLEPSALALLLSGLPPAELKVVVRNIAEEEGQLEATLYAIPEELLPSIFDNLDTATIAFLIERLQPEDAAWLHRLLDDRTQAELLAALPGGLSDQINRLQRFSPETAGYHMVPRFVAVAEDTTVGEAIHKVRTAPKDVPLFYLYVVDPNDRLSGVISMGQLVRATDETPVSELMTTDVVWVRPEDDQELVAKLVAERNILCIPVVVEDRLVGLVTVDDVIDVLEKEATEDMYNMAGLSEGDRVFSTPRRSLVKRLPWNALNLVTSLAAALMVSLFEGTISKLVALATFMPVVAGIGGNTGNQTLTVIIRGITLGELEFSSGLRALFKEVVVGVSIGVVLGAATAVVSYLWKGNAMLGVVIALAMVANLFVAAFVGTAIPLTLRRIGLDPALGGSILVTMCTDVFGFLSFLGLATLLMSHLL